ncbi:Bax inhibitor-1/YccA family protein [Chitinophagaceae bacterium MMS25-I14]
MDNYNQNQIFSQYSVENTGTRTLSKTFFANVFLWMFAGLGISAVTAFLFAANTQWLEFMVNPGHGLSIAGYAVLFAPLAFVLTMSFAFSRLSATAMVLFFLAYSAVNGISFSFILLAYTAGSILGVFVAASVMFGVMAILGYTTNKDLTSFGRIMIMGLIGIVVASLVNMFLHSSQLDYIVSFIGVMVFTGLTAYDVQKLKRIGAGIEFEGTPASDVKKLSIMGALNLYLDFVNLFLMLLRLFGRRRN